jgi:hypothetical protein
VESILTGLLQFGIGGAMAAAVLALSWWNLTRTIPKLLDQRESDLIWARGQLDAVRHEFTAALREVSDSMRTAEAKHTEQLRVQAEAFKAAMDSVAKKIESLVRERP